MALIDPNEINAIMLDCLFRDSEIINGQAPTDAVLVEAVVSKFGFHPDRLALHAERIKAIAQLLPVQFFRDTGGGWSFLNLCTDRNGDLWTGLQRTAEELLVLAMAIGYAEIQMPKELWSVLPGGVPYVVLGEKSHVDVG